MYGQRPNTKYVPVITLVYRGTRETENGENDVVKAENVAFAENAFKAPQWCRHVSDPVMALSTNSSPSSGL